MRLRHRPIRIILALVLVALFSVQTVALANHIFNDVPHDSPHAAGITYMKDTGITVGCGGPNYCPDDNLTRAQMGTFLFRASGNDPATPPSVNAATVSAGAVTTVTSNNPVVNATANSHNVTCPAGTVVVGGGGFTSSNAWRLEDSRPIGQTQWQVLYRKDDGVASNQTTTVYARCLAVGN